jgi:hypothetical protein
VAVYNVPPGILEKDQDFREKEERRWAREGIDRGNLMLQGTIREGTMDVGRRAIGRELEKFDIKVGPSQGLKFDIKNVKSSMQSFFRDKKWNSQNITILEVRYLPNPNLDMF